MNESEFENKLRALSPIQPAPEVESAIRRELEVEPGAFAPARSGAVHGSWESLANRLLTGLCWAAGGAAVAICTVMLLPELRNAEAGRKSAAPVTGSGRPAAQRGAYREIASSTELLKTEDGGLFYDKDEQPKEVLRYSSLERHAWVNSLTGARVEVEVPREDVVLVPVSFQ